MSPQYGELRSISGCDPLASLGHPSKFQRVLHLGSVTAWHCSSGRQPNFAALNRGRHLYLAGRPHSSLFILSNDSCAVGLYGNRQCASSEQCQAVLCCVRVVSPHQCNISLADYWRQTASVGTFHVGTFHQDLMNQESMSPMSNFWWFASVLQPCCSALEVLRLCAV